MLSVVRQGRRVISHGSLIQCIARAEAVVSVTGMQQSTTDNETNNNKLIEGVHGSRGFHLSGLARHSTKLQTEDGDQESSQGPNSGDTASASSTMDTDIMDQLCDKALEYVPTYGWSKRSLNKAAEELGLSPAIVGSLTRGPAELVEYFHAVCNQELVEILSKKCEETDDLREMLVFGLKTRLSMVLPYKDRWSEALALQASPTEAPYAFDNASKIADIVWRYAGDRSSDFTWYSKRAILMGIYTGAEVYMLADTSKDAKDTFDFIERGVRDLVV